MSGKFIARLRRLLAKGSHYLVLTSSEGRTRRPKPGGKAAA